MLVYPYPSVSVSDATISKDVSYALRQCLKKRTTQMGQQNSNFLSQVNSQLNHICSTNMWFILDIRFDWLCMEWSRFTMLKQILPQKCNNFQI